MTKNVLYAYRRLGFGAFWLIKDWISITQLIRQTVSFDSWRLLIKGWGYAYKRLGFEVFWLIKGWVTLIKGML